MELGLIDRVVVVTGASKGIGYACGVAFAQEGAKVALVARSRANLDAALARFPATKHAPMAIVADMGRVEDAQRMAAEATAALGPIDVLVNSAGAARRHAPEDLDAAEKAADNAERKRKLLSALASKEEAELSGMSKAEIEAEIAKLQ